MNNKVKCILFIFTFVMTVTAFIVKVFGWESYSERIDYVVLLIIVLPCVMYVLAQLKSFEVKGVKLNLGQQTKDEAEDIINRDADDIERAREYYKVGFAPVATLVYLFGQVDYKIRQLAGNTHTSLDDENSPIDLKIRMLLKDIRPIRNKLAHGEPVDISSGDVEYLNNILYYIIAKLDHQLDASGHSTPMAHDQR